jgi:hypothetical protein
VRFDPTINFAAIQPIGTYNAFEEVGDPEVDVVLWKERGVVGVSNLNCCGFSFSLVGSLQDDP